MLLQIVTVNRLLRSRVLSSTQPRQPALPPMTNFSPHREHLTFWPASVLLILYFCPQSSFGQSMTRVFAGAEAMDRNQKLRRSVMIKGGGRIVKGTSSSIAALQPQGRLGLLEAFRALLVQLHTVTRKHNLFLQPCDVFPFPFQFLPSRLVAGRGPGLKLDDHSFFVRQPFNEKRASLGQRNWRARRMRGTSRGRCGRRL